MGHWSGSSHLSAGFTLEIEVCLANVHVLSRLQSPPQDLETPYVKKKTGRLVHKQNDGHTKHDLAATDHNWLGA